ncbi:alternative ribosome rescue aminoacyl-tRNA hydrolase ArfB [Prochlorococcus marinus]|uniref:Aminoacyl-tRNA hydrolase n=1 Tax=Prochlorococcus marinus (strain MIT 9211) TaxID=93059 RepID=A9BC12_PROM4|nr:alternative ribosome rescue aminoacyl-tRNA hydrolase ArfB [Prochlorococcus marinus]ABX09374.1 Aminoacyl-tRNA hydrolase [Prochlorococcus marinus str. MIT 9211]
MNLTVNSRLVIPSRELQWRFSRSSGPGGQNVNKTDSKVELIFHIEQSNVLSKFQKYILRELLKKHIVKDCIRVVAKDSRNQYQNRRLALFRLANLLRSTLKPPKKLRKQTKPSLASKKRRLDLKKQRSNKKKNRQVKPSLED